MRLKPKTYREIDEEAFINREVIDKVDYIEEDCLLHDDSWKVKDTEEEQEQRHISELWRIADNMDKRELLTICSMSVRKYPFAYLQVLAEWIIEELIEKNRRGGYK